MLRQPPDPQAYPLGLSWRVPAQRQSQAELKQYLLAQLTASEEIKADPLARQRLSSWLKTAPVTGRVPIAIADARWLQAHPDQSPVLDYDHSAVLPRRPTTVTVLTDDGRRCALPHRAGAEALAYLRACQPDRAGSIDRAWLVQPDGSVKAVKIANWNAQAQDEPAPGARIWAPARDAGWPAQFSALLAEFLSTQYPGMDEADRTSAAPLPILQPDAPAIATAHARDPVVSANDWGLIGLMQTPTARMAETGDMRFHFSRVYPYGRGSVLFQPLEWLEAGFRYTNISNRLYGPVELSGDQAYKDKSLDFKLRLAKETASTPQIAFGITDIGGTGLFSSEYLVASKRSGDFDWSLGIGWGYLGGSDNIGNPFSVFGKGFDTRQASTTTVATGGTVSMNSFFHGTTALFGGVQYQAPWEGVSLKLEYDGNNYRHEPQGNNRPQATPINAGLVYRYSPAVDLTAGVERGNTFMLGLTLHGELGKIAMPKFMDAPTPGVVAARPSADPDWSRTAADLAAQTHWSVQKIHRDGGELRVVFDEAYGIYWNERIERSAAVLHRDAPADINRFVLVFIEHGIPMTERVILRDSWVAKHLRYQAMAERFEAIAAAEPRSQPTGKALWASDRKFSLGLSPSFQQTLGGPDGFVLFNVGVSTPMELRLTDSTWISGNANLRLVDNYDKFKYDAPSNLPRVRTFMREYLTTSRVTLPNLQVTHLGKLNDNQYYSAYAGYLESMFAGAGGEWLYRPWQSRFAFGVDANHVRQRDFKQDFALRDYRVNTGHATMYWDTGWKATHVNLSAGQYLAGDRGATVEVNKTFNNGVTLGAWATKTNVSAEAFGEGSFDKGIYVSIPFDAMLPATSSAVGSFVWNPLTRDGGARLGRGNSLYSLTNAHNPHLSRYAPANPTARVGLDDDGPEWASQRSIFGELGQATSNLGRQVAEGHTGSALLMGGGMVLAASLLDRPLANWAQKHQTSRWNSLGSAANSIPFLLAAGTGVLWWGAGGDTASETAWTSIKSAALTLGAETLTKYAVGRSRPEKDLGTFDFSPLGKGASGSSFPSIHMGTAFALVTPFAQQYDAPWLYAVAGATGFGRIQQRQHFASDVVAGSLIGYCIGSLLLDQQHKRRSVPQISIGPDRSIQATWTLE